MSCTGGGGNRPAGNLVQGLQHLHGALGFGLGAFHFELLMPVGNADFQLALDGAQVFVGRAAQVREARVVQRGEDVFENQADNPAKQGTAKGRHRGATPALSPI